VKRPSSHNSSGEAQPKEGRQLRTELAAPSSTHPGDGESRDYANREEELVRTDRYRLEDAHPPPREIGAVRSVILDYAQTIYDNDTAEEPPQRYVK
jgi:hypothetical protein